MTWLKYISPFTSSVTGAWLTNTLSNTLLCHLGLLNYKVEFQNPASLLARVGHVAHLEAKWDVDKCIPSPKGQSLTSGRLWPFPQLLFSFGPSPSSWLDNETRKLELQQLLCSYEEQNLHGKDDGSERQGVLDSWWLSWPDFPALVYSHSSFNIII